MVPGVVNKSLIFSLFSCMLLLAIDVEEDKQLLGTANFGLLLILDSDKGASGVLVAILGVKLLT